MLRTTLRSAIIMYYWYILLTQIDLDTTNNVLLLHSVSIIEDLRKTSDHFYSNQGS